jgi:hypothetical protein
LFKVLTIASVVTVKVVSRLRRSDVRRLLTVTRSSSRRTCSCQKRGTLGHREETKAVRIVHLILTTKWLKKKRWKNK